MRDYEKRFMRLEESVTKSMDTLREDMTKRLDTLSSFVQQEVDSLSQRIKTEKCERVENSKEFAREVKTRIRRSRKSFRNSKKACRTARAKSAPSCSSTPRPVSAEIDKFRRDSTAALNREVEQLRDEKTDRAGLADLFSEFSLRLKNKFELPDE